MAIDPYESCPCGSGKKFKWCCQPIEPLVEKAFAQHQSNQHEAALRTADELVRAHGSNPQAWAYRAQLLSLGGRYEEADAALDKALEINPNHPFALMLRGMFRESEGEPVGALLMYRKAAEAYHPSARGPLAELYARIGELELMMNRPVAARAALQRAAELRPEEPELRQQAEALFGDPARFPLSARKEYAFRRPGPDLPADQTAAWKQALAQLGPGASFAAEARVFERLTAQCPGDPAAWFNLGLARARLGDNPGAIEALDRSAELDPDESAAAEAVTLAQVLRCGRGAEAQADYTDHRAVFRVRDLQALLAGLQDLDRRGRLAGARIDPESRTLQAMILEEPSGLDLAGAARTARVAAHLLVIADVARLWHPNRESVEAVVRELQQKVGPALTEPHWEEGPAHFADVPAEAMALPVGQGAMTPAEVERAMAKEARHFFEEVWVNRPLKSLGGLTPRDVAGHRPLRKKLLGILRFLEECLDMTSGVDTADPQTYKNRVYDFDRLRRRLGLVEGEAPAGAEAGAARAVGEMSPDELAALPEDIGDAELEQAFRRAIQQQARPLADEFARRLTARPASPERPDRFPFYTHLAQSAQEAGDWDAALRLLEEGQAVDREANEGRRRADFGLRRGQVLAKRGDADAAYAAFGEALAAEPADLAKFYGGATEAMLGLRQSQRALEFAQKGLDLARKQNNRDAEQYFLELSEAARKQAG